MPSVQPLDEQARQTVEVRYTCAAAIRISITTTMLVPPFGQTIDLRGACAKHVMLSEAGWWNALFFTHRNLAGGGYSAS